MGVIKRGLLGGFSGKVANVVGSSWKGIAVIKSLPLSVANPNTSGQQLQRGKFATVVAFAGILLVETIKPLWDRFSQGESGYNAFISNNIAQFNQTELSTPAGIIISKGTLTGAGTLTAAKSTDYQSIDLEWSNITAEGNGSLDDILFWVVYNQTTKTILGQGTGDTRGAEAALITVDTYAATNVIRIWACFRKANGFIVSDTSTVSFVSA